MLFDFIKRFWFVNPETSLFNGGGGIVSSNYQISNSVRLRASASAYFSRTFGTPTTNTTWSLSRWIKKAGQGVRQTIISAGSNANNFTECYIDTNDKLTYRVVVGGAQDGLITGDMVHRDPSGHFHLLLTKSGTTVTAKINGGSSVAGGHDISWTVTNSITANDTFINSAILHALGARNASIGVGFYEDGYLSDTYFIDGQALTPSSFGQTDSNGVWVPKAYAGTYGNNGFHLDFKDANLTAGSNVGLGKDVSGNGNYWNTNSISVTAGVTYDAMVDTPTNNYCLPNNLDRSSELTVLNGGLGLYNTSSATGTLPYRGTQAVSSGKWYWEMTQVATQNSRGICTIGVDATSTALASAGYGGTATGYAYEQITGNKRNNASSTAYGASWTTNDVIGVALDMTNGKIFFSKNGTWQNSGDPAAGTGYAFNGISGIVAPSGSLYHDAFDGSAAQQDFNFGQRPFTYTPPTGFKSLCTANLPAVAIPNPSKQMAVNTRNGTGTDATKTGLLFQPDLVWVKARSAATDHKLTDAVRGVTKALISDTTGAETTDANGVKAFTSDGYTVGSDTNYNNSTGPVTYVDWLWKAGGAGVSNTDGSITSTVSANQTAGFSIVTFATGTISTSATVGHGLTTTAPTLIILKARGLAVNWPVYHGAIGNTKYLELNTTIASATSTLYWNSTSPSTTVFTLGSAFSGVGNMVAYCFAEIPGYSKFGSYVGNGSADGPFVYCGFRPKFVLVKCSSLAGDNWWVVDSARNTYNLTDLGLLPNAASQELQHTDYLPLDFTAAGFKLRGGSATSQTNRTGSPTYIFAAFAEFPFGGSNVSPAPAR